MLNNLLTVIPPQVLLLVGVMFLALIVVGGVLVSVAFGPRARLQKRVAAVVGGNQGKKGRGGPITKKKNIQQKLKQAEQHRQKARGYRLREMLLQANLTMTLRQFLLMCGVLTVVAAAVYALLGLPPIGLPMFALIVGLGIPRFVIGFMAKRRIKKFTALFPDAIDVIVRGIKSGLPVGECMNMIGREMPDPVAHEFRLITEAQRLGVTIDEAMVKTTERIGTAEFRFFAIVLGIQQTTGGNLAETLGKLSDVLRQRKKMRDKVAAMSSEAKASAGIIGSLPIIVTVLLSIIAPEYIGKLFTYSAGHKLLFVGGCSMSLGIFVMRQMINFEI